MVTSKDLLFHSRACPWLVFSGNRSHSQPSGIAPSRAVFQQSTPRMAKTTIIRVQLGLA